MEHWKRLTGQDDANDEMTSQQRREYEYKFNEAVNASNIFTDDINAYLEKKAEQEKVDDYLLDVEALARESYEYHHGSVQLPEYRQPKEKPKLDLDKFAQNVIAYLDNPDKTVFCKKCGMPIVDRDGNPALGVPISHTRAGAYYSCKLCHGITFAYDYKDWDAFSKREEQIRKKAVSVASDKSRRCGWCGKIVINNEGKFIHCSEDFYNPGRIVCHYCKHQI